MTVTLLVSATTMVKTHGTPTHYLVKRQNDASSMLHIFGHHVAICCNMLDSARSTLKRKNQTSAHAQAQQCCANVAKRIQHHATSKNVGRKI